MESLLETFTAKERKQNGVHYTPEILADFVAEVIVSAWLKENPDHKKSLRIIDPAVGDGELLLSLLKSLKANKMTASNVSAFDTNKNATQYTAKRITPYCLANSLVTKNEDFLEFALTFENQLFRTEEEPFDLVIANPPYVRTQQLGAKEAQRVSSQFDLSGRVDLYHAFIKGIELVLKPRGIAGIIVSNRFMTTKGGNAVREAIKEKFDIIQVWDLGDTKLFEAAVLPAVLLLRKKEKKQYEQVAKFSTIYSATIEATVTAPSYANAIKALKTEGHVNINGDIYCVQHGLLETGDVWRLSNAKTDNWLEQVKKNTYCVFGDVGKIAVGVKSTADKVFIRTDWDDLPADEKPELLKALITHHAARRFKALKTKKKREILYPHACSNGKRYAVDIKDYPASKAYLEKHRVTLESRKYVIEAGRNWYELWVPQDPEAWKKPKIVFRDISEKPEFWIDLNGGIVNGDCYWLTASSGENIDLLWLILAVGNSTFIEQFYDKSFNNKLYAGRRRFMTQYVQKFPLPSPKTKLGKKLITFAQTIFNLLPDNDTAELEKELDQLVWESFGLTGKEISG